MERVNSCAARLFQLGYSSPEALENIKDAAEIYIEDMIEMGEGLPQPSSTIEFIDEPAIAVSL